MCKRASCLHDGKTCILPYITLGQKRDYLYSVLAPGCMTFVLVSPGHFVAGQSHVNVIVGFIVFQQLCHEVALREHKAGVALGEEKRAVDLLGKTKTMGDVLSDGTE